MPEAIATTKRKFHKLLDTLTSYANASAIDTPPLTASEKLGYASERIRKRQRLSEVSSSSTDSLQRPLKVPSRHLRPKESLPNFSPWSQETFFDRLRTFSRVSLWHSKPESIDEVAWAKRGWRCVAVNTVACQGGCEKRVVVKIERTRQDSDQSDAADASLDEETYELALVEKYKEQITAGHDEDCMWRRAGCEDDIYRLQVVRPAIWQPMLRQRFESLAKIWPSIANVELKTHVTDLSSQISKDILPATHDRSRLFQIAVNGWNGTSELGADLLVCDACFQRVGLWMYQPGYQSKAEFADHELDLRNTHRQYCPWRNAESQHGSGTLSGLDATEILLKVINTHANERRRKVEPPEEPEVEVQRLPREEVERLDKERENRLQKLKRLLSGRRKTVSA